MSDLFHEDVPDAFIDRVFAVMALAPRHTFQILTKRADRMRKYFDGIGIRQELIGIEAERISGFDRYDVSGIGARWKLPLPNVWLGVSVENQHFADERIPLLLRRRRPSGSSARSRCSGR
jgi:protein gp37